MKHKTASFCLSTFLSPPDSEIGRRKERHIAQHLPLCYNVDMSTKTWTKQELKKAAKKSTSIRQVLGKLNLKLAGGNYTQIKKYLRLYKENTKHFKGKA
ncbi:MAG: hypothetical protein Q8O21_00375, partial [bacterium]|nr:hypothetical protein [bacterium]